MRGMKNIHNVLVGKPEGRRTLGKPRHGQVDDKINFKETVCACVCMQGCGMDTFGLG
jgi:hypothetical protein